MRKLVLCLMAAMSLCVADISAVENTDTDGWEQCARKAQAGDADAQFRLGIMYKTGEGVRHNPTEAFYWFKKAATNGNGDAMFEVGRCFRDGDGVIADSRIAAENFWRSAEMGNPEGAYCYAVMLRDGIGVSQDKGKAYQWFRKAETAGIPEAGHQADLLKAYSGKTKKIARGNTVVPVSKNKAMGKDKRKGTISKKRNKRR